MKKFFVLLAISILSFNFTAHAQCRIVAPDAKEWIENNQEIIKKMTRAEWQELEEGYKWSVFGALSPEQQHDFFRLKIEQVRGSFEWNEAEMKHINLLHTFFVDNPDLYHEEDKEARAANEKFVEDWASHAMKDLKWSQKLLRGIVMEADDLLDKEGNVRVTSKEGLNFKELNIESAN